jgi:hypothetical protein
MKKLATIAILAATLGFPAVSSAREETPQDAFFANLTALCGQRFEGKVVTNEAADSNFATQRLLMHVRDCSAEEIRIPFWVGEDHSRIWFITRTDQGLQLKHDHRDPDGTEHAVHWYGGQTRSEGTANRQEFPVDQFSIDLFNANGLSVSNTNVWAVEVHPQNIYAYELRRESRHFRVEFDLTKPVTE